jgi:CheY-like chemotaxis protein
LTILVVEDECLTRTAMADYLRDAGFVVLEAGSGEAALAQRETRGSIHLLFTDIRLGGKINGWDVAEAFRAWNPAISVLYTSGNSIAPPRNVERSLFFEKPYQLDAVADACWHLCGIERR